MENSFLSSKLVFFLAIALALFLNTELSFLTAERASDSNNKVYIVYIGQREHDDPELVTASHHQMLESLLQSKEDAHKSLVYSYQHGFSGFAALLTSSQAKKISEHPSVIHVIPNRILKLKTTRTWDHLGLSPIPTSFSSSSSAKGLLHDTNMGSETIIGVVDTGTVRGGSPRARIASYKVCWNVVGHEGKCTVADMWKAFDDAIHDQVDVLSVSIGGGIPEESEVDKLSFIAAFHAVSKGITVVAAAGNDGPGAQNVTNAAPWLLTVAATTLDRSFPTKIILGNKQTLFAESLFTGPEISTGLAFLDSDSDDNVMKGKTVLVFDTTYPTLFAGKGVAAVILAQKPDDVLARYNPIPYIFTDYEIGTDILQYIRTTRSPTVRICAARTITGQPAMTKVAAFSSRGPNSVSPAILKVIKPPDIAAPGVSILAAVSPLDPDAYNGFGLHSGTSMSTPVVSGIIALLKSLHPNWSPAAMRSALVTTAWRTSPSGEPIFAEGSNKKLADPFDYGGGLVNPEKAAKPGLVYDMGIDDYINYMCSAGYNDSSISRVLGKKTNCPIPGPSILDINLPSITIPNLEKEVTLTRTVTNVGPIKSVYKAVIEPPLGITLTVNPTTLVFKSAAKRVVTFSVKAKTSHKVNGGYFFGSLTWTDGVHDVTIPVSVKTEITIKP
ncbi:subtilase family protein [Arabidopsis lyrata subsp. lyrata]|uniref:Subtilase family protein n=1 Tax=Arabidopsis lyrata subsp. lyrata TaxID=81972 RepID=D7MER4_ARALL|nr:subtilase family protein [Arabidopsis lyrata subsp. lyrata]